MQVHFKLTIKSELNVIFKNISFSRKIKHCMKGRGKKMNRTSTKVVRTAWPWIRAVTANTTMSGATSICRTFVRSLGPHWISSQFLTHPSSVWIKHCIIFIRTLHYTLKGKWRDISFSSGQFTSKILASETILLSSSKVHFYDSIVFQCLRSR